jgi:hypothetical protein
MEGNRKNWNQLTDCRFFLQNKCRFISEHDRCPYRHPVHLLPTGSGRTDGSWKVCPKWDRYLCYDVNCPNLHPASVEEYQLLQKDQNMKTSTLSKSVVALRMTSATTTGGVKKVSPSSSYCVYYMRGKCVKGDNCPYLHERHQIPPSSRGTTEEQEGQQRQPEQQSQTTGIVCKRKAENILIKHSFKKSLQNNFQEEEQPVDVATVSGEGQERLEKERIGLEERRRGEKKEFESSEEGIVSLCSSSSL